MHQTTQWRNKTTNWQWFYQTSLLTDRHRNVQSRINFTNFPTSCSGKSGNPGWDASILLHYVVVTVAWLLQKNCKVREHRAEVCHTKWRGTFGCSRAIGKHRHNVSVSSVWEDSKQTPCLFSPTLIMSQHTEGVKRGNVWSCQGMRTGLQFSANSTKPSSINILVALLSVMWCPFYLLIKCKCPRSTTLTQRLYTSVQL